MVTSIFIAEVLGWCFVIFGLFILIKQDIIKMLLTEVALNPVTLVFKGSISVILGLLLIVSHNFWVIGWPVLVTIIGWFTFVSGLINLFAFKISMKVASNILEHPRSMYIIAAIYCLIGLYLLYHANMVMIYIE